MRQKFLLVDDDIYNHIKDNFEITSFNDWVNQAYRQRFMTVIYYQNKLQALQAEIDSINKILKAEPKKVKCLQEISSVAIAWLQNHGLEKLNTGNPGSIEKVLKYFNEEFGYSLKVNQFFKLINEVSKK